MRKFPVKVGVPAPGATGATVAVKVTDCPNTDGLTEETINTLVEARLTSLGMRWGTPEQRHEERRQNPPRLNCHGLAPVTSRSLQTTFCRTNRMAVPA